MSDVIVILFLAFLPVIIFVGLLILILSKSVDKYNKENPTFNLYRKNGICIFTGQKCKGMTAWNTGIWNHNDCRQCVVPLNHKREE